MRIYSHCFPSLSSARALAEETAAGRAKAGGLVFVLPDGVRPEVLARFADLAWHGPEE